MDQGPPAEDFDEAAFAELREDLGDSFAGFVEQFIATAHAALDDIDRSLSRVDRAGAVSQAHSLRGTAGYLGATAMVNALDALQHAAERDGGDDDARRHATSAREAFVRIKPRLMAPR